MAIILAAANGYFNTGATWVGGVVPGPWDEARPAGFTVAITSNITCDLLHNVLRVYVRRAYHELNY
jgi:hypothetical protein